MEKYNITTLLLVSIFIQTANLFQTYSNYGSAENVLQNVFQKCSKSNRKPQFFCKTEPKTELKSFLPTAHP